jgi:hypothetical protein
MEEILGVGRLDYMRLGQQIEPLKTLRPTEGTACKIFSVISVAFSASVVFFDRIGMDFRMSFKPGTGE